MINTTKTNTRPDSTGTRYSTTGPLRLATGGWADTTCMGRTTKVGADTTPLVQVHLEVVYVLPLVQVY